LSRVGPRVNEARTLDLADVKWELGRFGTPHVRVGQGARGSGPRERMVPLIDSADRTVGWFISAVDAIVNHSFWLRETMENHIR